MKKPSFEIEPLSAAGGEELAAMTFPVYRPLLSLAPTARHPEQGDAKPIQPIAAVARARGVPIGLAIGELPLGTAVGAELLSLFVQPEWRNRGVGRSLVEAIELRVAAAGQPEITAVYTTGKPSIAAVERILWKRAWEAPEARTLSVRFEPARALSGDLFDDRRTETIATAIEIVAWAEVTEEERRRARESHQRSPWITPALAFWRFPTAELDLASSLGAKRNGELVGWVLNHHVGPGVVRFTCSFLRKDLSRRGRIVPLYRESIRRLAAAGTARATFVTPVEYGGMIGFIQRRIAPVADFLAETRGSRKRLATAAKETLDAPSAEP